MAASKIFKIRKSDSAYSIIIEDDGRVAYAYLLDASDSIIADVWLYNRAQSPEEPEWTTPEKMPFLNSAAYSQSQPITPVQGEQDINVEWIPGRGSLQSANVLLRGALWAILCPGERARPLSHGCEGRPTRNDDARATLIISALDQNLQGVQVGVAGLTGEGTVSTAGPRLWRSGAEGVKCGSTGSSKPAL